MDNLDKYSIYVDDVNTDGKANNVIILKKMKKKGFQQYYCPKAFGRRFINST